MNAADAPHVVVPSSEAVGKASAPDPKLPWPWSVVHAASNPAKPNVMTRRSGRVAGADFVGVLGVLGVDRRSCCGV